MPDAIQSMEAIEQPAVIKRGSRFSGYLRAISAMVWKDLTAELRSRELLSAMLVFALLVILIFNFALELDIRTRETVTSGVLWVTFAFAGTLGLNRSMAVERDRGCLDGLLLVPVDRSALYFGKVLGNLIFMLIVEAITLPVYSVLYDVTLFRPGLMAVILLGFLMRFPDLVLWYVQCISQCEWIILPTGYEPVIKLFEMPGCPCHRMHTICYRIDHVSRKHLP